MYLCICWTMTCCNRHWCTVQTRRKKIAIVLSSVPHRFSYYWLMDLKFPSETKPPIICYSFTDLINVLIFFSVVQQPNSCPGSFIFGVLGSHTIRLNHSVEFLRTIDQLTTQAATYITHDKHNRRKSTPSARIQTAIRAIERLQA